MDIAWGREKPHSARVIARQPLSCVKLGSFSGESRDENCQLSLSVVRSSSSSSGASTGRLVWGTSGAVAGLNVDN